jgi:hypothetical protein
MAKTFRLRGLFSRKGVPRGGMEILSFWGSASNLLVLKYI